MKNGMILMLQKISVKLRKTAKYIVVFMVLCFILGLFRISAITTYIPFTGRYFDIEADEVEEFVIQHYGDYIHFDSSEDIEMMCNHLNSMRYRCCLLFIEMIAKGGGPEYWLWVDLKDGTSHRISLGNYSISLDNSVGAWILYYPPEDISFITDLWTQRSGDIVYN